MMQSLDKGWFKLNDIIRKSMLLFVWSTIHMSNKARENFATLADGDKRARELKIRPKLNQKTDLFRLRHCWRRPLLTSLPS
jgi:hypothetical protein